ncbi:MAG: GTPase Era [Spirochaetaceae bacterium]
MTKAGFCAIVGRPSSGKSTLLNTICGHRVSIVSPIPQTTRNKVRGIHTVESGQGRSQIVFVDTPGFHESEKKLNRYLREVVTSALEEIDAVLYVADVSRPIGPEEEALARLLAQVQQPVLAALNKVDVTGNRSGDYEPFLAEYLPDSALFPLSATENVGIDPLVEALAEVMPESQLLYPPEYYTDQDPEFRISEIIREQAIAHTREEVPHAIYAEVADMEVRPPPPSGEDPRPTLWIRAFIAVERETQKGIVVGRGGAQIRDIRKTAQAHIAELFDYRIHLDLRVKVHPKWRRADAVLTRLVH